MRVPAEPALLLLPDDVPFGDELFDRDRHAEVALQQIRQRHGRHPAAPEGRRPRQQQARVERQIAPPGRRAEPQQREQGALEHARPGVVAPFVGDREVVLGPGAVEQRDQAVVEQIEKVAQRRVAFPQTGEHVLRIDRRQAAETGRGGHAHERHGEPCRPFGGRAGHLPDVAGRKRQRDVGGEADRLAARVVPFADRDGLRSRQLQQSHRLEELEAVPVREQQFAQVSVICPARGGHRFITPSCWRPTATVWVNEFTVV